MIKAVLFDLDGTLINTNELIIETYKYTLKKHLNLSVKREDIVNTFGEPLLTTLQRYDRDNAEELMKTYKAYNELIHDEKIRGIEGACEALTELKRAGLNVGVVTSKRRNMAERGLKLFNLMDVMDIIITPEDTKRHKPNGEPVLKACECLGIEPYEALYVGDSHYDILCGKNANAKTCLVKYTALSLTKLMEYNPDYTVDRLEEILQIVEKENKGKTQSV